MKKEREIKKELDNELKDISINTFVESPERFWVDFGYIKALLWMLRK